MKQKNNFNKRADRRSFKVPAKVKYDSFSMKAGSLNLSLVVGGNNFLGKTLSDGIIPFLKEKLSPI